MRNAGAKPSWYIRAAAPAFQRPSTTWHIRTFFAERATATFTFLPKEDLLLFFGLTWPLASPLALDLYEPRAVRFAAYPRALAVGNVGKHLLSM